MQEKLLIQQAIDDGLMIINHFHTLKKERETTYQTHPSFTSKPSTINCFIGQIKTNNTRFPLVGCIQTYTISNVNSSFF